ncbi:MAG TPA: lysylphosphatidylglycerol synthase transmembrane domain-containing protein, partial [Gaiellaceae bacterium]|nr:lysylphosphatidylglycerol synthase transmembrane domain-containing protein [Gaiellaceae bacterium]
CFAWRNILAAAYPGVRIRRRGVFGAYAAGVGINAIAPARAGDLVKLYLVKRRIEGATYPTLAPTLVVETLVDFVVATGLFAWALTLGVLPSRQIVGQLPSVDWAWPFRHLWAAAAILGVLFLLGLGAFLVARRRVADFRRQFERGFAILGDVPTYLRRVASWQLLSWVLRLASVFFFLRAFDLAATVRNALLVQVVDSLSTLLPFTPGGAGTKQGLLAYVLHDRFSVSAVLSFSVGMNIALVAVNVVVGFACLFLLARTIRWRRLAAAQKKDESEGAAPA